VALEAREQREVGGVDELTLQLELAEGEQLEQLRGLGLGRGRQDPGQRL